MDSAEQRPPVAVNGRVKGSSQKRVFVRLDDGTISVRFIDVVVHLDEDGLLAFNESVVGYLASPVTVHQAKLDAAIVRSRTAEYYNWHMLANQNYKIGTSEAVLNELEGAGIGVALHFPQ